MISRRQWVATLGSVALCTAGLAVAPAAAGAAAGPVTQFDFTGSSQTYVVPTGVTSLQVEACAAAGSDTPVPGGEGGHGAQVTSTVAVVPGETLTVTVGGLGDVLDSNQFGGFNGGGNRGGGGATDLRRGGTSLTDRVVVAGGGGAAGRSVGGSAGFPGGDGGLVGANAVIGGSGATQTAGGAGQPGFGEVILPGFPGTLGVGGAGHASSFVGSGGGGGLYGGGGGAGTDVLTDFSFSTGGGGGGSSLADEVTAGACEGDGWLRLTEPTPVVAAGSASVIEGDAGSTTVAVPLTLSTPAAGSVTVDWATVGPAGVSGIATSGVDFAATSGTVEFAAGETTASIDIDVLGDTTDEPPLFEGEWGLIVLTGASANVQFGTGFFARVGIFVIGDDDPTPTVQPGVGQVVEGGAEPVFVEVPVTLSNPSAQAVTTTWHTLDLPDVSGLAQSGIDFVSDSGTVTFAPGETEATITVEVVGDEIVEPELFAGEWGLIFFDSVSPTGQFGTTSYFDRLGVFVIVDNDALTST